MQMPNGMHLGYSATEMDTSPYAAFYRDDMAALAEHVKDALLVGGQAHEERVRVCRGGDPWRVRSVREHHLLQRVQL